VELDPAAKSQIKAGVMCTTESFSLFFKWTRKCLIMGLFQGLYTLNSPEAKAGIAAAQVIAAVAAIELPRGDWPDLVKIMLENVTNAGSSVNLKQSTLQAIGFVCEEIVGIV
jgi:hypothetical protein